MSPKCTQFWIIPSHLVPMNSVWIPSCVASASQTTPPALWKLLPSFDPPQLHPDPLKSIHCLSSNHSEIYPSLSTATDTHHSAPPAKITVITPLLVSLPLFSSLYQAICSTRLTAPIHYSYPVIPSKKKKKKSPTKLLLLSIIYNSKSNLLILACKVLPPSMPNWPLSALLPILSHHCLYQASFPAIFYSAPCK